MPVWVDLPDDAGQLLKQLAVLDASLPENNFSTRSVVVVGRVSRYLLGDGLINCERRTRPCLAKLLQSGLLGRGLLGIRVRQVVHHGFKTFLLTLSRRSVRLFLAAVSLRGSIVLGCCTPSVSRSFAV